MNIKNLVKVAKVVAAVAMVGVVSGCASFQKGDLNMGEVRGIKTGDDAVKPVSSLWGSAKSGGLTDAEIAREKWVLVGYAEGVFGGGGYNHTWALVPPGIAPEMGDFVEVSNGAYAAAGQKLVPNTVTRITRKHGDKSPGGCNWGCGTYMTGMWIYCDGKKQISIPPEEACQPQHQQ